MRVFSSISFFPFFLFFAGTFILAAVSCKSRQIQANSGAYVTIDGTNDGLQHIQKDFQGATKTNEGILVTFDSDVLFALNSADLSNRAKSELNKLVVLLEDSPQARLVVDGHTDATGPAAFNQTLSEKGRNLSKHTWFPGECRQTVSGQMDTVRPGRSHPTIHRKVASKTEGLRSRLWIDRPGGRSFRHKFQSGREPVHQHDTGIPEIERCQCKYHRDHHGQVEPERIIYTRNKIGGHTGYHYFRYTE